MAICRECACYASHQAVGLARPCRHSLQGRKARLRRFMEGRHPEPGLKHMHVGSVVHFRRGEFEDYRNGLASGTVEPHVESDPLAPEAEATDEVQSQPGGEAARAEETQEHSDEMLWDPALMAAASEPPCHCEVDDEEPLFDDEGMGPAAYSQTDAA